MISEKELLDWPLPGHKQNPEASHRSELKTVSKSLPTLESWDI